MQKSLAGSTRAQFGYSALVQLCTHVVRQRKRLRSTDTVYIWGFTSMGVVDLRIEHSG